MKKSSFESQHKAFVYLFAGAITLATLPVLGWHYVLTLSGLAMLSGIGPVSADIVLWFAALWSVSARSWVMKATCIIVKLLLACTMVFNAGVVIFLNRGQQDAEKMARIAQENRNSEIAVRARAAEFQKTRTGVRETLKMGEAEKTDTFFMKGREAVTQYVPDWYLDVGIYVAPFVAAILGFLALHIVAAIVKRREEEEAEEASQSHQLNFGYLGERTFKVNPDGTETLIQSTYPEEANSLQQRATQRGNVWRGGQIVNGVDREDKQRSH
jgi:hypothetical protein